MKKWFSCMEVVHGIGMVCGLRFKKVTIFVSFIQWKYAPAPQDEDLV